MDVVLFHHALGLTPGVIGFADQLRAAGHVVHTPDLYAGRTLGSVQEGVAHAAEIGFDAVMERGVRAADELTDGVVYAGISLGVMPAQKLAQTRAGCRGALLLEACLPVSEFGTTWPATVPVQIHGHGADPSFAEEGDLDAARQLVADAGSTGRAELFVYPGDTHLFTDAALPSYDADAAALLMQRILAFLDDVS
jgi:dienelactone hydrolase